MKEALRYLAATLVVIFGLWILGTSSSFKTCKAEQAAANAEQRKENPRPFVLSLADSAAICIRCAGHVLYEYRDAATAVATVLIAIFTYTLYGATKGLVQAAEIQSADMKRSIVAAAIAADAAQSSAETAKKALFAANRPVITIGELELVESDAVLNKPVIKWGLRNPGPGFAVVNNVKVEVVIQGDNTPRIFSRQFSEWHGTIELGKTSSGHQVTTPTMQARIKDILAGRLLLYFNIELQLMDIMENPSNARFPFIFDSQANSFKPTSPLVIGDEKQPP
jgi:hypothetical protein